VAITAAVRGRPATCSRYAGLQSSMVISSATPSPSMTRYAQLAAGTRSTSRGVRSAASGIVSRQKMAASSSPQATPNSNPHASRR
jgi:hypothetical protein